MAGKSSLSVDELLRELDDLPGTSSKMQSAAIVRGFSVGASTTSSHTTASPPPYSRTHHSHSVSSEADKHNSRPYNPQSPQNARDSPGASATTSGAKPLPVASATKAAGLRQHTEVDDLLEYFDDLPTQSQCCSVPCIPVHSGDNAMRSGGSWSAQEDRPSGSAQLLSPAMPRAKCTGGLFLGGPALARGRNSAAIGEVLCCDCIRCTKCDFKVRM